MATQGIRGMLMRGGTSKGMYFLASDLPADPAARDELLLRVMGSPDARQIDGVGGGQPLTSKVAVVSANDKGEIEYLFLQVVPDKSIVSAAQNCGNILAGVGPFAIERGLIPVTEGKTRVPIRMLNSGSIAVATVETPAGVVNYAGGVAISGVPGGAAPVLIDFSDTAGSTTGALFPTGEKRNVFAGVEVTCIDNGMPVVLVQAANLGVHGAETPAQLEENPGLREMVERIRLQAGMAMGLGDVAAKTVPKISLISPPSGAGVINTRTFIPHKVHTSIGVLGAASVAAGALVHGTVADGVAELENIRGARVDVEHPTGVLSVEIEMADEQVVRTGVIRTARKIMDGVVFPRETL